MLALTIVVAIAVGPDVLLTEAVVENIQLFASLTSTAYVPAARLGYTSVAVNALPSTEYVYGASPPVTAPRVIEPLEAPQAALTIVVAIAVGPLCTCDSNRGGEYTTVCIPDLNSICSCSKVGYASVAVNALPSTEYVYGASPPVTAPSVIEPFEAPHAALTTVVAIAVGP